MLRQLLFCFVLFFITAFSSYAQKKIKESAVPAEVIKTYKKKYARGTDVVWRKISEQEYDVDFVIGGKVFIAKFSADGKWLETETDVTITTLPKPVKDQWKKNEYKDWEILYVIKLETPDTTAKPKICYQITVKKDKDIKGVFIAADGKTTTTHDLEE